MLAAQPVQLYSIERSADNVAGTGLAMSTTQKACDAKKKSS